MLSRRTVLLGGIALGASAAAGTAAGVLLGSSPAGAAGSGVAGLDIIGCDAWGARPPSEPIVSVPARPQKIIVHHTATPNSTDVSRDHAISLARSIQNSHMDGRGFKDTGQHFTVSRGAFVLEGRHQSLATLQAGTAMVESAHTFGQNRLAIGIENEGTYITVEIGDAHYARLLDLITQIAQQYGIPSYQVYGHRDFNNTQCPGDRLYARIPKLRADLAARIGGDPTGPVWPTVRSGATGERVTTIQYLLRQAGSTIAADGDFGPQTLAAVRAFQDVNGASIDGVVGNQSWNQLEFPVATGAGGEAVRAAQSQLTAHGIATAVDGQFGARTRAAVTRFQVAARLPATGAVDARTWSHLVA
jgi:hypothetical protein